MQLHPGGDVHHYLARLREQADPEQLRSSPQRADHLSRVGAILAMDEVTVRLDPDHPTATITSGRRRRRSSRDGWEITITSRGLPQPVTDYTREAYDMLTQETLLVHEVGHLRYTDYDAFRAACERMDAEDVPGFQVVFNAAEDVAIESQLRSRFSVGDELDVLNANLFEALVPSGQSLTVLQAVELAILDLGVWESGRLGDLLGDTSPGGPDGGFASVRDARLFRDDVLPLVRELVEQMRTTADGAQRVDHIRRFWEAFTDAVADADDPGVDADPDSRPLRGVKPDDADLDRTGAGEPADALAGDRSGDSDAGGQDGEAGDQTEDGTGGGAAGGPGGTTAAGTGDGADEAPGGDPGDADGTGDPDGPGDRSVAVDLGDPEPGAEAGDDSTGRPDSAVDGRSPSGTARDGEDDERRESMRTDRDLEEAYAADARSDARSISENNEALAGEVEAMMAAVEGAADEFAGVQLDVPVDPSSRYDDRTYQDATRVARWIARELGDRLRQERRQRPIRRRSTGALDTDRMTAWQRGDHRIFSRTREGGEKEYHAMFVADRSSSMGGPKLRMLERSVGGMVMGLEEIGVETAVLDLFGDEVRLVKPFGVSSDARRSLLFSGRAAGATPLRKVVAVARERLNAMGGNRFLVIVTDGQVGETEAFKSQIDRCHFPVLGVYLAPGYRGLSELTYFNSTFDYEGQLALFHRYRTVFDQNELNRTLRELCREVMF